MKKGGFTRFTRNAIRVAKAFALKDHPFLAQIIPMRNCNLACAYCNEYEKGTNPVPLDEVKGWIDKLADLGTAHVTISGGEPMMHLELDEIIAHIRKRSMIAGLITNGYYLKPERIRRLNSVGLEYLQISIDNVEPDEVSRKSLKLLDKMLRWLSEHAEFEVNINSVLGAGIKNPEDALVITKRAIELGFKTTVGIIHKKGGHLKPLGVEEQRIYLEIRQLIRVNMASLCASFPLNRTVSTGFKKTWSPVVPMNGAVVRVLVTSTSTNSAESSTARSSAAD